MTIKSIKFLRKLKNAQIDESHIVWINSDALQAKTISDSSEPCRKVDIKKFKTSIGSVLSHLEKLGFIVFYTEEDINQTGCYCVKITHSGWCWAQTILFAVIKYAFTSVIMPIAVSVITTLIMLYINGYLIG